MKSLQEPAYSIHIEWWSSVASQNSSKPYAERVIIENITSRTAATKVVYCHYAMPCVLAIWFRLSHHFYCFYYFFPLASYCLECFFFCFLFLSLSLSLSLSLKNRSPYRCASFRTSKHGLLELYFFPATIDTRISKKKRWGRISSGRSF